MKKLIWVLPLTIMLFACNSKKDAKTSEGSEKVVTSIEAMTIDKLLAEAEGNVGKEVFVKGMVNHTCKHSGRRCFLVNEDESLSIRVEAGGDITSFNQELIGNILIVKGILEEKRLTSEYIDEFETKVKAQEDTEEGGEHCDAQMQNIKKMRAWMKEHAKEYYPIYFVAGQSYEVVE